MNAWSWEELVDCNAELWTNTWHVKIQYARRDMRLERLDDNNFWYNLRAGVEARTLNAIGTV